MSLINGSIASYQGSGVGICANDVVVTGSNVYSAGADRILATSSVNPNFAGAGIMVWDEVLTSGTSITSEGGGDFRINQTGVYMLHASLYMSDTSWEFLVNGSVIAPQLIALVSLSDANLPLFRMVALTANDLVQCAVRGACDVTCANGDDRLSFFEIVRFS